MAFTEEVQNRLYNWKFKRAEAMLTAEERVTPEGQLVVALSERYGQLGWIDGTEGEFVSAVVGVLIKDPEVERKT